MSGRNFDSSFNARYDSMFDKFDDYSGTEIIIHYSTASFSV